MLENFTIISQQVLVLFILIAVGFVCGKKGILNDVSSKKITDIVLYAVTPCVMISAFQREFSVELLGNILLTALIAAAIIGASILAVTLVFRDKDEKRKKVLRFACVFSNCGFMSLPLQKAILGDDGWFYGSIFVAVFNIFVWTYGLVMMSGDRKQLSLKKIAFNPGIIGVAAAIVLFVCKVDLPYVISQPIEYLAALNTPLPMLIIGYYLSCADLKKAFSSSGTYLAAALRLMLIPLLSAVVMLLLGVDSTIMTACLIAASAPSAANTTMFAAKFGGNTELSVSIVAATTLMSIVTMPLLVAAVQTLSA